MIENYAASEKRKKSIFIATPAYEGKVYVQYAMMLLDLSEKLKERGFEVLIRVPTCGSLLVADRNRLIQMFWDSGADYILCIDNDLAFQPEFVLKMIDSGKEFVGGVYPSRDGKGFTFRPVLHEDGRIEVDETKQFLKMEYIPAGCMLIKRSAIAKMREKFPELYYEPKDPNSVAEKAYCLFDTQVWEGEFWGEDYVFCRRARQAGIDIWVDPLIYFNHAGVHGALMETLTTDPEKAQR